MITKRELSAVMQRECDICVHLSSKFETAGYEYRPSPGQRSTIELMRYLAISGSAGLQAMAESSFASFAAASARVKEMTPSEFPAAMARQKLEIAAFFDGLTEEDLATREVSLPGRPTTTLGMAILAGPFIWLPAYKLQLFLYAKAAGATEIGTSNAWRGVDAPPKVA
jgi:hypothetical protein